MSTALAKPAKQALVMLEMFCFGSGMTRAAHLQLEPQPERRSRARTDTQAIQHFSPGVFGEILEYQLYGYSTMWLN